MPKILRLVFNVLQHAALGSHLANSRAFSLNDSILSENMVDLKESLAVWPIY